MFKCLRKWVRETVEEYLEDEELDGFEFEGLTELEDMRRREMRKSLVIGLICGILGYILSFSNMQPFPTAPDSSFVSGEYQSVSAPFYPGSIFVVLGCILLVLAVTYCLVIVQNLRVAFRCKIYYPLAVAREYSSVLAGLLLFLLYMTCTQVFEGMARLWTGLLYEELPMYQMYGGLRLVIVLLAIATATEGIHCVIQKFGQSRWAKWLGRLLCVVSGVGVLAATYMNLWYGVECMVAFAMYQLYLMLLWKREEKLGQKLIESEIMKELGL